MRGFKNLLVLFLCACIMFFSGCTAKQVPYSEEIVTLRFLMYGVGEMRDSQEVWDIFNEKLQEFIPNTRVEFDVVNDDNYAEKWKRICAARETVDVVWIGYNQDVRQEMRQGNILPLDDYYQYVPDLVKELPEWIFELGRYNGKSYLIPNSQMMTIAPYGVRTHKVLAEKYNLDIETITKNFNDGEVITREDFKPFEDYLEILKQNGELGKGVSKSFISSIASKIGHLGEAKENIVANTCIDWTSDELRVYDRLDDFPMNDEFYDMTRQWYEKGYIREDILKVISDSSDMQKKDGYVLWAVPYYLNDDDIESSELGFEVLSFPLYQKTYISSSAPTTNLAIPSTATDPVRSIKLIELLNTEKGKELYNLLVYGIEGRHYEKLSDTKIKWLQPKPNGESMENAYGYYPWALGNSFNAYETQYMPEGWNDYIEKLNASAPKSPLMGFVLDPEPIELELAQYAAINAEYATLELGAYPNYKELLAERKLRLKRAGSDRILEEVQRQINEWKNNKE